MDHKSTAFRTALSFTLSILFHVSLVAGGAVLGAFFVKSQPASQAKGKQTYQVTMTETAEVAATEPAVAVEEIQPEAAPVQPPPPVAKKAAAPKKAAIAKAPQKAAAPAKKIVALDFSEASVDPQAPIEVNDSIVEPQALASSDDAAAAAEAATTTEPLVKSEDITEEALAETTEATEAQEPAPAPAAATEAVTSAPTETAEEVAEKKSQESALLATVAAAPETAQPAGTEAGQAAEAPATKEAPQNFLTLKQAPGNKAPSYPNELRKKQVQGKGQLKYYVNKDGRVGEMQVTQSTGSAELDKVALDAFSKYKFVPGQEGYTVHNFEFSLKGPAEAEPRRLRTTYNR